MKSKLNTDSIREKHKAKKINEQAYIRTSYFQKLQSLITRQQHEALKKLGK